MNGALVINIPTSTPFTSSSFVINDDRGQRRGESIQSKLMKAGFRKDFAAMCAITVTVTGLRPVGGCVAMLGLVKFATIPISPGILV